MSMIKITASVGENAKNQRADVRLIQQAMNILIRQNILVPMRILQEDGIAGMNTKAAIREFQRRSVGMSAPDGRIDPGGKSLKNLNKLVELSKTADQIKSVSIPKQTCTPVEKPANILADIFQQFNRMEFGILSGWVFHACPANSGTVNIDLKKASREDFVKVVFAEAKKEELVSKVPAAITTAQAILETGYGKSVPTDITTKKYSYNLFGIKGTGPAGSVSVYTHEFVNGKKIQITDTFKAYKSFSQSISGRTEFLTKNKRYKFLFDTTDAKKWAEGLQKAGYATDPKYAEKLIAIMNQWKLI